MSEVSMANYKTAHEKCELKITSTIDVIYWCLLYPPYPKDRGMLWFYVEAARRPPPATRRPQWC